MAKTARCTNSEQFFLFGAIAFCNRKTTTVSNWMEQTLLGYSSHLNSSALSFLKDTVSQHDSWKVQEILAMAFDKHCKIIGYDVALPLIEEWFNSNCANVRRAVSEGLRTWTNRPYFRDNPQTAIQLLSAHREDTSEYVRKSVGNALRDISKKYSETIVGRKECFLGRGTPFQSLYYFSVICKSLTTSIFGAYPSILR